MTSAATIASLLALGRETEWIEFKRNKDDPETIGEYASALSNSAALLGQPAGYVVWGIDDATRQPVGTTVDLRACKIGNEEFENWLARQLEPRIGFEIGEVLLDGHRLAYLGVNATAGHPVRFKGTEYIRIGTLKKKLKDHPGKEADLWRLLERRPLEMGIAAADLTGDEVIAALDYPALFQLLQAKLPEGRAGIREGLPLVGKRRRRRVPVSAADQWIRSGGGDAAIERRARSDAQHVASRVVRSTASEVGEFSVSSSSVTKTSAGR